MTLNTTLLFSIFLGLYINQSKNQTMAALTHRLTRIPGVRLTQGHAYHLPSLHL